MPKKYSQKSITTKAFSILISLCACALFLPTSLLAANTDNTTVNTLDNDTHADSTANKDLDVVLVMDSSGSMKKTDPGELRKPAAKLFISLLGAHDRAGVVSFSDQGYPVTWLTPVKGNNNRVSLFNGVDRISSKGVYTNLHGALEGAIRVFNRAAEHNAARYRGKRQHIIVLMSDGKMDVGNDKKEQLLTEQLLRVTIPSLRQKGIEVHTIAFTSRSDQELLKEIAETTGGTFNIARTDRELHDAYMAIFEQNKSPNILPFFGEKFIIDKTIKEVTIVGSKDSAQAALSLITPDGRMLKPDDKGKKLKWFTSDQFDLITITNPASGEWQLKNSAGKDKAYVITDLKQELDIAPQTPMVNKGLLVKTWLEDKGVTLTQPSVKQTLSVELRIHTPQGQVHEINMKPEVAADGTPTHSGAYTSLIALPVKGSYQLKVIVNNGNFSREKDSIVSAIAAPAQAEQTTALPDQPPEPVVKQSLPAPEAEQSIMAVITDTAKPTTATNADESIKTPEPHPATSPSGVKDIKSSNEERSRFEPQPKSDKTTMITAILIFVGFNVFLAAIGAGAYFIIVRRKHANAAYEFEADNLMAAQQTAKARIKFNEKKNKAA